MFTGLVEAVGHLEWRREERLRILCPFAPELAIGDSVNCAGVCLTVEARDATGFEVSAVPATLRRTTLGAKVPGDGLNLERAVPVGGRLGGHIVQGHVDGTGMLVAREPDAQWEILHLQAPQALLPYLVPRGAIAVDGVSLTVAALAAQGFSVAIIPHTAAATTLGALVPGGAVNLEADILAKYVEGLLDRRAEAGTEGAGNQGWVGR